MPTPASSPDTIVAAAAAAFEEVVVAAVAEAAPDVVEVPFVTAFELDQVIVVEDEFAQVSLLGVSPPELTKLTAAHYNVSAMLPAVSSYLPDRVGHLLSCPRPAGLLLFPRKSLELTFRSRRSCQRLMTRYWK